MAQEASRVEREGDKRRAGGRRNRRVWTEVAARTVRLAGEEAVMMTGYGKKLVCPQEEAPRKSLGWKVRRELWWREGGSE